jgi:hypothetical protein
MGSDLNVCIVVEKLEKMFVLLTTKLQPYEAAIPSRAGAQWARSVKNVKKHQT